MKELLIADNLKIGYLQENKSQNVLGPLSFKIFAGDFICIMGANGCGKTTLIKTLSGILSPISGTVLIKSKNINEYDNFDLAHQLSVVLTDKITSEYITVWDLVALGRYPHLGIFAKISAKDEKIISDVLHAMGIEQLAKTRFCELSDGQKQKTMIARALAQQTPIIILDEPTTYLDIPSRMEILYLLRKISIQQNVAVIFSSHDWDLTLEMVSKVWLITKDGDILSGLPEDLVMSADFDLVFGHDKFYFDKQSGSFKTKPLTGLPIYFESDGSSLAYWTFHALKKEGFQICTKVDEFKIKVEFIHNEIVMHSKDNTSQFKKIENLITAIYALRVQ